MIAVPESSLPLHAGPQGVTVDSTRLGPELLALAGVLGLLIVFKALLKLVGRL